MPRWRYSVALDPVRTAVASGRDLRISYKAAVEVLKEIRGKKVDKAKQILEDIIEMKRAVSYKRYYGKVGHRRGMGPGRYPVKAAKAILSIIENAEANAEFKGLDTTRLWIVHAAAFQGMKLKKFIPRAFGRTSPYFQQLVHVEIGLEERL